MALKFQCDMVWPALGAFDKAVVKGRHESCGIYTKNLFTAERAEIAENKKDIFFGLLGALCVLGGESLPSLFHTPVQSI